MKEEKKLGKGGGTREMEKIQKLEAFMKGKSRFHVRDVKVEMEIQTL